MLLRKLVSYIAVSALLIYTIVPVYGADSTTIA